MHTDSIEFSKSTPTVLGIVAYKFIYYKEFIKHLERYGLNILSESWCFTPEAPPMALLKTFKHKH